MLTLLTSFALYRDYFLFSQYLHPGTELWDVQMNTTALKICILIFIERKVHKMLKRWHNKEQVLQKQVHKYI